MRRSLRPYKPSLQQMPKASSSMSDFVYDPCGNRYRTEGVRYLLDVGTAGHGGILKTQKVAT
jgi:hypothetical protein